MAYGDMRHRCTIEEATETPGVSGGNDVVWSTKFDRWFSIEQTGATEDVDADRIDPVASHIVRMHYVDGLTTDLHRLNWVLRGRIFGIVSIENPDGIKEFTVLGVKEAA